MIEELNPADLSQNIVTDLGLEMTAEFVPHSKSRNAHVKRLDERQMNWKVTFTRKGRNYKLTTDFSEGIARLMRVLKIKTFPRFLSSDDANAIERGTETGKIWNSRVFHTVKGTVPPPDIKDVLCCLVLDSSVIDYTGFESWAQDMGCNPDSMKDKAIYDACMKTALELRQLVSDSEMRDLREAFNGY